MSLRLRLLVAFAVACFLGSTGALAVVWLGGGDADGGTRAAGPARQDAELDDPRARAALDDGPAPAQPAAAPDEPAGRVAEPAEAPLVPAGPLVAGVAYGVVLDARTREPVPEFQLNMTVYEDSPGEPALWVVTGLLLVTDAEGRFATNVEVPFGTRIGGPWVDPDVSFDALPEHAGDELELLTLVGPTFHLELDTPEAFDQPILRAVLVEGEPDTPGAIRRAVTEVRGHAEPWARFDWSRAYDEEVGEPRTLLIESANELWRGTAQVNVQPGVYPRKLHVRLEGRGLLRGDVRDDTGRAVTGAELRLEVAGEATPRIFHSLETGAYSFDELPPGSHRLAVRSGDHHPWELLVPVGAGVATEQDVDLQRLPVGGDVRGELRSRTGTHRPDAIVYLDALEAPFGSFEANVEWEREGDAVVGRFVFRDLPSGAYAPQLLTDDHFDWEGPVDPFSPPRADLVYVCDDDVPQADLALLVTDAAGRSVGAFEGWWYAPMDAEDFRGPGGRPEVIAERYPLERPLRWFAWADGYGVARGTEADFAADAEVGPDARLATARLPAGWGAVVTAWDEQQHPLAGVRAVLDGQVVATTDGDGVAVLHLAGPPTTFAFEHDTRVWIGGDLRPGAPRFSPMLRVVELEFARR